MLEIFYLDGKLKRGSLEILPRIKNKLMWIDAVNINKLEADVLVKTFNLHQLTIEDIFRPHIKGKIEEFPNYIFFVLYGINGSRSIKLVEQDFVLGKNFLITSHLQDIHAHQQLKRSPERIEMLLKKGKEFLFHKLLEREIENYFPVLEHLDEQVQRIEEEISQSPGTQLLSRILKLKRTILEVKKAVVPQRENISILSKEKSQFIPAKSLPYFRDILDHSIRVADAVESYREAINAAFEAYMSSVSMSMNEVMKVLTIIGTIFIPLTFITGLYGMNFQFMPELNWKYGYFGSLGLMLVVGLGMLVYFRKKKWI
jgi:magnesium transporter